MAVNRGVWRYSIFKVADEFEEDKSDTHKVADEFEEDKSDTHKDKRSKRKDQAVSNTTLDVTFTCVQCSRSCLSRIGLVRHEFACR